MESILRVNDSRFMAQVPQDSQARMSDKVEASEHELIC